MESNFNSESIKGDRSMTQGFVAQYAAEAALRIDGVVSLVPSFAVALKEKAGVVHEGKGVRVVFDENDDNTVSITCYPVISYGKIIPEVAWLIQEKVKGDVEKFTGLNVDTVDVYVCGVSDTEGSGDVKGEQEE
ncbi:MAG: Asp23/Gls24 family envelope stress response protein [Clostridiales bacterium]|nr:Asp23/Gls24 family envelope stress response protein [Clostridiales bacterium]MBQ5423461.1 Asp23/Gls24 family envelope stress response protein [Clostridiales bacterium]